MSVDASGEIAFEDAADLAVGLALGASAFDVGASAGVVDHSDETTVPRSRIEEPPSYRRRNSTPSTVAALSDT